MQNYNLNTVTLTILHSVLFLKKKQNSALICQAVFIQLCSSLLAISSGLRLVSQETLVTCPVHVGSTQETLPNEAAPCWSLVSPPLLHWFPHLYQLHLHFFPIYSLSYFDGSIVSNLFKITRAANCLCSFPIHRFDFIGVIIQLLRPRKNYHHY